MNMKRSSDIREFIGGYLEAALWASTAHGVPEDTQDGTFDTSFESYGFGFDDIAPKAKRAAIRDCIDFFDANRAALCDVGSYEQHGHDFWLTRCGHGAGFWDRGYGEVGDSLSDAARVYGSQDLYVGDDGKIWGFES